MTHRFTIKKEIRSLGIDLCNPERVIGAIVRGGLYLDGIMVFSTNPPRWNTSIGKGVLRTRFYPELKLIMTHDPEQRTKTREIERIAKLPVIEIRAAIKSSRQNGFRQFRVTRGEIQARSSLESRIVLQVLERTWTTGSLPESLRIAHLIAKSRFLGKNWPVLG